MNPAGGGWPRLTAAPAGAYPVGRPHPPGADPMPDPRKGVRVPLSPARKMVCELLRHGRRVPTVPVSRELDVAAALAARDRHPARPSWVAVFMKAYALVA